MSLFSELRRRNVFKVALLYAVASWLLVWVVRRSVDGLGLSPWISDYMLLLLAVGFPVALIFAWTYEITPAGLQKAVAVDQTQSIVYKTGQKLNAAVAVLAVLGFAAVIGERLLPEFTPPPKETLEEFPIRPVFDFSARADVPKEIASFNLPNGLEVIVWPDHDIPNVALYYFVRAGGRNEYPGVTGIAHFFEHMMFNGTKSRDQGEFDSEMEAAGGANNASTSKDVTVYMDWFPRSALETVIELESDRLLNLAIDRGVVETERGAVYSERRQRIDDSNFGILFEQMFANAYVAHPYQNPVIGWPTDIENWTQQDLEDFFRTYYAPNNITMIFSGDVTPEEIYLLADQYFSPIPRQHPPPAITIVEPGQRGERRFVIEKDAQTPLLHVAFHGGAADDEDALQRSLLLSILGEGDSSRLHRALVEEEGLAVSVGVYDSAGFDPGLVYFYLTLPPGGDVAAAEARLLEELDRAATQGVDEAELEKARNLQLAAFWRELETIRGKASALGNYEVFNGDYETLFAVPEKLAETTPEALQSVAAAMFRRENMTVGILHAPAGDEAQ
ncbi:MAG: insulinase family protein [Gammaproteobacteria bacterium]|nr:insulinase family protein [Gammaproteobacteria bacterium]NNF50367.1 insulinase family protein [Woeseiaceae bacterium]MBT8094778.1 insulinase family protein [Gammaproteobacteria bacterium]MBT8104049.1 insulinase family protein [Gammaproteobacteria bacterium]NNK24064.1 insulinase family protein [Woeseiaceae bacterium]